MKPRPIRRRPPVVVAPLLVSQLNCEAVGGIDARRFLEVLPRLGVPIAKVGKLRLVDAERFRDSILARAYEPSTDPAHADLARQPETIEDGASDDRQEAQVVKRGLREILVEAAHALADALEGRSPRTVKGVSPSTRSEAAEETELEQRNERMRLALNERAQGDLRELKARGRKRPLTDEEHATIAILSAGYRLMPNARDELRLTTPLADSESTRRTKGGPPRRVAPRADSKDHPRSRRKR